MQYWENLEIGNKLELFPLAQAQKEEKKVYLSKIQDIKKPGELEILMPIEKGKMKLLSLHTRYLACFYTKVGIIQGECIIQKRYKENTMYFLGIQLISHLSKKQRREYYRLECNQEVHYRIISESEEFIRKKLRDNQWKDSKEKEQVEKELSDIEQKAEWIPAILLDISGGGLHVKTAKKETIEKHLLFHIKFYMEDITEFDLECQVVFIENIVNELKMVELRCQYLHITNQTREIIIKYIFDQQRKQRAIQ